MAVIVASTRALKRGVLWSGCALVLAHGVWDAIGIGTTHIAVGARAAWPMEYRFAQGIGSAHASHRAGVLAISSDARLFAHAIQIIVAFLV